MSRIVVETAGCVVVEEGPRVHFAHRSGGGLMIAAFVLGLLTLITTVNGVAQIALAFSSGGGHALAGVVLLGLGTVVGGSFAFVIRRYRRVRAAGVETLPRMLSIDRSRGVLLDGVGRELGLVGFARTQRTFQAASSYRALTITWQGGSVVVARGSPFVGDVGPIEEVFRSCGVGTRR
jgi:hypothetical protein